MIAYTETVVHPGAVGLWNVLTHVVGFLPGPDLLNVEIRCHELARACHNVIVHRVPEGAEIRVVDGHYGCVDHSWIELLVPDGRGGLPAREGWNMSRLILDVYAVGQLPPVQLVDTVKRLDAMYKEGPERADIDGRMVVLLEERMNRAGPPWPRSKQ